MLKNLFLAEILTSPQFYLEVLEDKLKKYISFHSLNHDAFLFLLMKKKNNKQHKKIVSIFH